MQAATSLPSNFRRVCRGARRRGGATAARGALAALAAAGSLLLSAPAAAEDYTGLVYARHDLTLSVSVPGVVSRVPVAVGQQVQANQALLQLEDRIQGTEVQRRKILLDDQSELRATEERVRILTPLFNDTSKLLSSGGSVSRDEVVRLQLELVSSRSRVEQLRAQELREKVELTAAEQERDLRRLVAPVAGVVTRVDTDIGEWARPGDALIQLVDAAVCYLRLNVPAAAAQGLKVGGELPMRFEQGTGVAPLRGKISYISPVIDAASGLVELRVTFANPDGRVPPGIKGIVQLGGAGTR
ncbi:hypothetical protein GCM10023144_23070 [Pigmentiphaga soli]|uniref:CusB-like beta-barrel domain-containing protein n=1 Tax=Pigmentiphaga soli TaxID=1007095 RepID=A0ABP8H0U3_9BURK